MDYLSITLLILAAIVAVAGWAIGMRPLRAVGSHEDPEEETDGEGGQYDDALPSVSVIVHAISDEETLTGYLDSLLDQDYPDFEVIVVYDATCEAAAQLSERYADNNRIHITFVPPGSHNLSRRKLAITLGVKAAKGDVVITTSSNCIMQSRRWLRLMARPFTSQYCEVGLGYTRFSLDELKGPGRWYRQFDYTMTSCSWLGYAIEGRPWRGDGNNLAFRRELFFNNKGYASTIFLHGGDDDLFVNEITNAANTVAVTDADAQLTMHWGESAARIWTDIKERHDFTSRWLPRAPFMRAGWLSASQWIVPALCVAAVAVSWPVWWMAALAAVIWMLFALLQILTYRKAAGRLGSVRLWFSLPLFLLWRPVGHCLFRLSHRSDRFKNFTWQRH